MKDYFQGERCQHQEKNLTTQETRRTISIKSGRFPVELGVLKGQILFHTDEVWGKKYRNLLLISMDDYDGLP